VTASAREAAVRPFGEPGRRWWLVVGGLSAVVLAGVMAWVVQLFRGMAVAGYDDGVYWSVYIADVITFIGVSYGGAVVSAILRLTGASWRAPLTRLAEGTAVVTVLIGSAFIIPHLGRPDRLWELVKQPNLSSPVFWDFVAVMTYMTASIVFFFLPLVPDMAILREGHLKRLGPRRERLYAVVSRGWIGAPEQRRVLARALGLVSILIIPLAVSVHSVLAWAFALTSPPWWHESIWAPSFVVAALYSGVALVILVLASFRRGYHLEAFITEKHFVRLGLILATFSATYLYLTFADFLPGAYVGEAGPVAVFERLLIGQSALWFWLWFVAAGILPLLLIALPWTRKLWGVIIAAAVVVPAMWVKRILMVIDPSGYDRNTGTFSSYHFTWVAVLVTLGGVAAVPLLLMLLFRVVPLLSIDEMEEADAAGPPAPNKLDEPPGRGAATQVTSLGGVLLIVVLLCTLNVGAATPVQAAGLPSPPRLTLEGVEAGTSMRLTARLTDTNAHRPLAQKDVTFYFTSTEFGPRRLFPLGSVATDAEGVARLTLGADADHLYKPTATGPHEFVVSYAAGGRTQLIRSSTTVDVTVAKSAYHPAPPKALAGVGRTLVIVLFTLVAAIWLTLAAQVLRVRRVCRSSTPRTTTSSA
jgi:Ni/Fe-hydrogenase subunit HybB-like protein